MRNRLREFALLLVFALLAGHCLPAGAESRAETAQEITAECRFETNGKSRDFALMTDGDLSTFFPFRETKGILTNMGNRFPMIFRFRERRMNG